MGKYSQYESNRKYNKEWEKSLLWIAEVPGDPSTVRCKLCHVVLKAHFSGLKNHEKTEKHMKLIPNLNQPRIPSVFVKKSEKEMINEIKLSAFVGCHSAIRATDHLTEILTKEGQGSNLEKIKLKRTKATMILKNVIAVSIREDIVKAINAGNKKFSVLIDESTDCSTNKLLAITLRYYNIELDRIVDEFLGLVEVVSTTGESLYDALKEFLCEVNKLPLSNLIGFASDGANNVSGLNNSCFSRVKEQQPNVIQVKCVMHSLALAVQWACEKLPSAVTTLVHKVPAHFAFSGIRRSEFLKTQEKFMEKTEFRSFLELIEQSDLKEANCPNPFQRYSRTRFLVRGPVLQKIMLNWSVLLEYLCAIEKDCTSAQKSDVRVLIEILRNNCTKLLLQSVVPVIVECERVNKLFQAQNPELLDLERELRDLFKVTESRIFETVEGRQKKLHILRANLGYKFTQECKRLEEAKLLTNEDIRGVRETVVLFLSELVDQLKMRISRTEITVSAYSQMSPGAFLNGDLPKINELPFRELMADEDRIEAQILRICLIDWKDEGANLEEPVKFWGFVRKYERVGERIFEEIADYALSVLTIPCSTAFVERIFSIVSYTKNLYRNRMKTETLNAVLTLKSHLQEYPVKRLWLNNKFILSTST